MSTYLGKHVDILRGKSSILFLVNFLKFYSCFAILRVRKNFYMTKFGLKSKIWLKMSIFQIYDFRQIVINGLKPIFSGSKLTSYLSVKLNEVKLRHFLYSSAFFENWFLKIPKFAKHLMERRPAEPFMLVDLKKTRHCPLEESLSFPKNKNSKNVKSHLGKWMFRSTLSRPNPKNLYKT